MSFPKITVLVPSFNRADYLAECLDSIFNQTLPPYQVIVVNDGSDDHTMVALEPYMAKITFLQNGQGGKPVAINLGLRHVTGDYLWIFDDDDVAAPDALERLVEPLQDNPEYGFSYCTFWYSSTDLVSGRIGKVMRESQIPDVVSRGFLIPLLESDFIGGAALFARTECYHRVGEFDPTLIRSQDYEMAIRIARSYNGVRVSGKPVFHYRQHMGMRGSLKDRFLPTQSHSKWLQYDQSFFRRLYRSLPLTDFIPPGTPLSGSERQALLQRMCVMLAKLLLEEAFADLFMLIDKGDDRPFSCAEKLVIASLYGKCLRNIKKNWAFMSRLHQFCRNSPFARRLRLELCRLAIAALPTRFGPRRAWQSFLFFFSLYGRSTAVVKFLTVRDERRDIIKRVQHE